MKFLLFKLLICFAAALAAPADKQKRNILPGDPRYGTEHHQENHHEHENEVLISKAAGGYVGSYTVPDNTEDNSFQVQSSYGPPSHIPGKPLGTDLFASSDIDKTPASVLVPSTSYGIPDTTQILNNNFIGSIVDDKKPALIKHEELVNVPQTSYGTPVVKTTIQDQPKLDTVQVKTIPEIHDIHVQPAVVHKHVETAIPQVKVTAAHLPTETQGIIHHSVPSFTSAFNIFPSYISPYSSYNHQIPVKTVNHQVQVKVPQPYQVPVTKHVAVPVPVPHAVEVPKPYYVGVPQPVQVTVDRPYPVEVSRPVPYPVPHYVKTSVPVAQHHLVDTKATPIFFHNTQTFPNVVSDRGFIPQIDTFASGPLEGFQNFFENFQLPSLSSFPSFPSFPSFIPGLPGGSNESPAAPAVHVSSSTSDSITVENPALKTKIIKPAVQPIITHHVKQTQQAYKPSTACAGCTVTATGSASASSKQEYVQPTDANGGYVY